MDYNENVSSNDTIEPIVVPVISNKDDEIVEFTTVSNNLKRPLTRSQCTDIDSPPAKSNPNVFSQPILPTTSSQPKNSEPPLPRAKQKSLSQE